MIVWISAARERGIMEPRTRIRWAPRSAAPVNARISSVSSAPGVAISRG